MTPDILDLIEPALHGDPDRLAVCDYSGDFTYGELSALSAGIAEEIRRRTTDSVVIHARLSRWAIAAMVGALRARVGYVAIDAAFPAERRRRIAAASGSTLALAEPGLPALDQMKAIDLTAVAPSSWTPSGRPSTAYTCFTSGSTGEPKGISISTTELGYSTLARLTYYRDPPERFLLCSSISFDSSVAGIYWTLASGGRLVIGSDRAMDPVMVGRAVEQHHPTHLLAVPSFYALLLRMAGRAASPSGWDSLVTAIVAGEVCPPSLVRQHFLTLPRARLYNEYGPTECTVWSTVHRCTEDDGESHAVPIGLPIPGTSVSIRTSEGDPVEPSERGELWISGPGVASSLGCRSYRTGDIASAGHDGCLYFHGRLDDQLKFDGFRVERGEIEQALRSHPAISSAAVGVAYEGGKPVPVAFIVPSCRVDARAVRTHLLARLPASAVPKQVSEVAELPLTPTGKVDHRELDRLAGRLSRP